MAQRRWLRSGGFGLASWRARLFGALLRQAATSAARTVLFFADLSRTFGEAWGQFHILHFGRFTLWPPREEGSRSGNMKTGSSFSGAMMLRRPSFERPRVSPEAWIVAKPAGERATASFFVRDVDLELALSTIEEEHIYFLQRAA